jgi:hypothetical protein
LSGSGAVLRFFLLGAGLAAGRIVAIHLGATLGAVLGVLRVLALARRLRVAAALTGVLRAVTGFCVVTASALFIACRSRAVSRRRGLASFLGLSGTGSLFVTARRALRLLFRTLRAFLPLGAAFLRCSTLAGIAWPHLFLLFASCSRRLAVGNGRCQHQADDSRR